MEEMTFLTPSSVSEIRQAFGSPVFVYDQRALEARAVDVLAFPNAYGLTVRYAMKALPTAAVLRVFHDAGLHIDASSGYEAERAMRAGIPPEHIQITAQELPRNLLQLVTLGVLFNASSLCQLEVFGQNFPGHAVGVRINPGMGSGHSNRTNVGGPSASFGIWHEHLERIFAIQHKYNLQIIRMHTHIGSGSDPAMWEHCATLSLGIAARLPQVTTLSLGGGFKVGRMPGEVSADLQAIGQAVKADVERFHEEHGRKLHLEIEPGTYLAANAGALIATVIDVVDTGRDGCRFIKTDTGMTEILRPSIYGAQHPIDIVPGENGGQRGEEEYLVVGHCCESGDILTPEPGNPEGLQPRRLTSAEPGDAIVIGSAGAYCSAMASKNYNSFPEAAEVLLDRDGTPHLIRQRQTLDQMLANEVLPEALALPEVAEEA
jgi:diaminopimelate decarboxylase